MIHYSLMYKIRHKPIIINLHNTHTLASWKDADSECYQGF